MAMLDFLLLSVEKFAYWHSWYCIRLKSCKKIIYSFNCELKFFALIILLVICHHFIMDGCCGRCFASDAWVGSVCGRFLTWQVLRPPAETLNLVYDSLHFLNFRSLVLLASCNLSNVLSLRGCCVGDAVTSHRVWNENCAVHLVTGNGEGGKKWWCEDQLDNRNLEEKVSFWCRTCFTFSGSYFSCRLRNLEGRNGFVKRRGWLYNSKYPQPHPLNYLQSFWSNWLNCRPLGE